MAASFLPFSTTSEPLLLFPTVNPPIRIKSGDEHLTAKALNRTMSQLGHNPLLSLGFAFVAGVLAPLSAQAQERRITMGISERVIYGVNQGDAAVAVNLWAREIASSLGLNLAQKNCFMPSEELLSAIRARSMDVACLTLDEFRRVEQFVDSDRILCEGGTEMLLVVSQSSGITGISGLKGRRLIIHDNPHTALADAWLTVLLGAQRLGAPAAVLSRIDRSIRAPQAVLPVFFGQADACIASRRTIETMIELNPQLASKIKILESSPKLLGSFLVVGRHLPPQLKDSLLQKFSHAYDSGAGKQVLTLFQSRGFSVFGGDVLRPSLTLVTEAERVNLTHRVAIR
jgi:hypothetical protein